MSGVFGIYRASARHVAHSTYYGLYALQHRGQETCGIVVCDDGVFNYNREAGLVGDVFNAQVIESLGLGAMAVGHVRYGKSDSHEAVNAGPMVVKHIKGPMAIANDGNVINAAELREQLEMQGSIFHTTSDTEVLSYVITSERLHAPTIEDAVVNAMKRFDGAYSLILMSATKIIGARDPRGFRPLLVGKLDDDGYAIASETAALDAVGAQLVRDVRPGEVVVLEKGDAEEPVKVRWIDSQIGQQPHAGCIFEHIYFARPDSELDGVSVHAARTRAGQFLARSYPVEADVVIGVPDSGLAAAQGYARESGIPYDTGFIKNKYIGRTFISPTQESRERGVKIKLSPVRAVVEGKRVVIIDDSIVRGTTSRRIISLLREAGATEVHLRVSAPPFVNPCYYGTDIDSRENLIACHYTQDEIRQMVGADSLGYLSLEDVKRIAPGSELNGYCTACFDGNYPTRAPKPIGNTWNRKLSESKAPEPDHSGFAREKEARV